MWPSQCRIRLIRPWGTVDPDWCACETLERRAAVGSIQVGDSRGDTGGEPRRRYRGGPSRAAAPPRPRCSRDRPSPPSPVVLHGPLEFVNLVYFRKAFPICRAFGPDVDGIRILNDELRDATGGVGHAFLSSAFPFPPPFSRLALALNRLPPPPTAMPR